MPSARPSPRIVLAVLAAAVGSFSLLQSLVAPVLPTIQRELHTSASAVTWVLTAWLLSAAVATPLLGRVGASTAPEARRSSSSRRCTAGPGPTPPAARGAATRRGRSWRP